MARVHYWSFLVNELGEPIGNAEVSVYLAGTTVDAIVFTDEFRSDVVSISPQILTRSNGYFEFWISDLDEGVNGYDPMIPQKFKVSWEKQGIASGTVDYVDIFPATTYVNPVDETDYINIEKDKTVSNRLANIWNEHANHDVVVHGFPVHGMVQIDISEADEVYNKIPCNKNGFDWENHRNSTVQSFHPSAGTPHNLVAYDDTSQDVVYNKVINNLLSYTVRTTREDLNILAASLHSDIWTIVTSNWIDNHDGSYSYTINHNYNVSFLNVTCWDTDTNNISRVDEIKQIDSNNIRITVYDNTLNLSIRISN